MAKKLLGLLLPALLIISFNILSPAAGQSPEESLAKARSTFRATGRAVDIDYNFKDFILKEGKTNYAVLADMATVQLAIGVTGGLSKLKEGAYVRVIADKLSPRTLYATRIIVLDDKGLVSNYRIDKLQLNAAVNLMGTVARTNPNDNEIIVHLDSGESVVVIADISTVIRRSAFDTDIYGIFPGDRVNIIGRYTGLARIKAERITAFSSLSDYLMIGFPISKNRLDWLDGIIISRASEKFSILCDDSIVIIELGSQLRLRDNKCPIRAKKGDKIRVKGAWLGRSLTADNIEVLLTKEEMEEKQQKAK